MYEFRNYKKRNTDDLGSQLSDGKSDDGFWGAKIDWQINDRNLLELLAFSDKNKLTTDVFDFDLATAQRGTFQNTEFVDSGGHNWAATYTAYLTEGFSAKALYGKNERDSSALGLNDIDCSRVRDFLPEDPDFDLSCTSSTNVSARVDDRKAARLDFEWRLTDHQLRFGLDREQNTSDFLLHYPGPGPAAVRHQPHGSGRATGQWRHRASRRHCLRAHPRQCGRWRVRDPEYRVLPRGQLVGDAPAGD